MNDDSRDGTSNRSYPVRCNPRVRCTQRIGCRGLATACIEGVLASCSPCIAVIDVDLQHDEQLLPHMLDALESGTVDLVIGSRYVASRGFGDWSNGRIRISGIATRLVHFICKPEIADPLSGFFMRRREVFKGALRHRSGQRFKVYWTFSPHRRSR